MNTKRRLQLNRKSGRRLAAAFRKLIRKYEPATIDIEMFWPPDHDRINFLVRADCSVASEAGWDFTIPTSHWQIAGDPEDDFPPKLLADIRSFFRSIWKEICLEDDPDTRAYLRLHEDQSAIDLRNGRRIEDRDRPDYVEPARMPLKKSGRSTKRRRRDGELIRRGDSLSQVKKAYKISQDPDGNQYHWPDRGIRIQMRRGKVHLVVYFDPFPGSVGGIWIGAHAWEVEEILGRAKAEFSNKTGRLWQYDVDGFMSVGLDRGDRVEFIGR